MDSIRIRALVELVNLVMKYHKDRTPDNLQKIVEWADIESNRVRKIKASPGETWQDVFMRRRYWIMQEISKFSVGD